MEVFVSAMTLSSLAAITSFDDDDGFILSLEENTIA
jgi:hypothetical protein